jgi:hypothetical protein
VEVRCGNKVLLKLERAEMRMVKRMCGISLIKSWSSEKLRSRIGAEAICLVMRGKWTWFDHMQQ